MVVVEGIYSMEGEICKLPDIISICKKYKVMHFFCGEMKLVLWCRRSLFLYHGFWNLELGFQFHLCV